MEQGEKLQEKLMATDQALQVALQDFAFQREKFWDTMEKKGRLVLMVDDL